MFTTKMGKYVVCGTKTLVDDKTLKNIGLTSF